MPAEDHPCQLARFDFFLQNLQSRLYSSAEILGANAVPQVRDELNFKEVIGLTDLGRRLPANALEILGSKRLTIVTSPRQWDYAVIFPIERVSTTLNCPIVIQVSGWVNSGAIGVGLVRFDRSTYIQEVLRTPVDGLTTFELVVNSLDDCWAVVVRNTAESGVPSKLTIESMRSYGKLSEPTSSRAIVRWNECQRNVSVTPRVTVNRQLFSRTEQEEGAPKISLILTLKNGMPYLTDAMESLRHQEFSNFEVIVQDCESRDGSLEYVKSIKDLNITLISEQDEGIGDAWSRALPRCRGEIIGSIDADNLLKPDALSTAYSILHECPWAAAVYGGVEMIRANGERESYFVPEAFDLLKLMSCQLVPPWSTAFFSRAVCGADLFFDRSITVCVDFDVWLRISHLPILQTSKILGSTRLSEQSMSCSIASYERFCDIKIQALEGYLRRKVDPALSIGLLRHGIAGIYCWAAESTLSLGAAPVEAQKFLASALRADASSDRARKIQEWAPKVRITSDDLGSRERQNELPTKTLRPKFWH